MYHALNRANGGATLFADAEDYAAFERVLEEAVERTGTRLLTYCVMPNHWHLVVWPHEDGELSEFMGWLTLTHTQRRHSNRRTVGEGHLYQGRFKSFPVQDDAHFLTVCRYVERNPLRAGLVARADDWRYGGLWRRMHGSAQARALLCEGPVPLPRDWLEWVQIPLTGEELEAVRRCATRGCPFGVQTWVEQTVEALGLQSTMRPRGRPRKRCQEPFSGEKGS